MEKKNTYRTVRQLSEGIYKEKGSRFIAYAVPCYSEAEAKEFLESWRKSHHQARHVCYAYRFGLEGKLFRANDDGEPNNSAGAPILGQIQSFDLSNVLIGVVRYFGGTKLGVGGLITAYKTAAKEALENADIIEIEVFDRVQIVFNYGQMPSIMNFIKQSKLNAYDQDFGEECRIKLPLPLARSSEFREELNKLELTTKDIGIW